MKLSPKISRLRNHSHETTAMKQGNRVLDSQIHDDVGADIRALRKARKVTLTQLADQLGRSLGWLSQVERNISMPSIDDLRAICTALDAPVSILFRSAPTDPDEHGVIVRASARRAIGTVEGLSESLLSPDLTDDFEVVHSTFAPGAERTETTMRETQELAYLVSGQLDIWIGDKAFSVATGDSFRIRGAPYRWANPYPDPAVAIWVIAPPVY